MYVAIRGRALGARARRRARHREQLRAQQLDQIVRRQPRPFEATRDARDLFAVHALEPVQRAVDAAHARGREVEIAGAQVIPPARDVRLVVFVQARGQLAGEVVARDPVAAASGAPARPARWRGALPTRAAAPGRCGARSPRPAQKRARAPSITLAIIEGRRGAEQGPPRDGPRAGASPTFRSDETAPGRSRERRGSETWWEVALQLTRPGGGRAVDRWWRRCKDATRGTSSRSPQGGRFVPPLGAAAFALRLIAGFAVLAMIVGALLLVRGRGHGHRAHHGPGRRAPPSPSTICRRRRVFPTISTARKRRGARR